jgi:hypothetical protein
MMKVALCELTTKDGDQNWCPRHGVYHRGHYARYARDPGEKGQKFRAYWDERHLGKTREDEPTPQSRSLLARATAYARALARHKANGSLIVPDAVRAQRRAVCDGCPQLDVKKDECRVCGCKLHHTLLGDKLAWASESCPRGKWGVWIEPEPALQIPDPTADFPNGVEPAALRVSLSVEDQQPLEMTLAVVSRGSVQVWSGQGVSPIRGQAETCGSYPGAWSSPYDWSASVARVKADGPNQRFSLALERFTPDAHILFNGTKLKLLSLSPFLAVGQGLITCGTMGTACSPCRRVAGRVYGVTVTEASP